MTAHRQASPAAAPRPARAEGLVRTSARTPDAAPAGSMSAPRAMTARNVLRLQGGAGNAAVSRMLASHNSRAVPTTEASTESEAGEGANDLVTGRPREVQRDLLTDAASFVGSGLESARHSAMEAVTGFARRLPGYEL